MQRKTHPQGRVFFSWGILLTTLSAKFEPQLQPLHTAPDSIVPDFANPQSLNRYSYVYNRPIRFNDPTGHCPGCFEWMIEATKKAGKWFIKEGLGNRIDHSESDIPFANVLEGVALSLAGEDRVYLGGNAIDLIRDDPAFRAFEQKRFTEITSNPLYMETSFQIEFPIENDVRLGGVRNMDVPMKDQLFDSLANPSTSLARYEDTWNVAGNELSWLLRGVDINSRAIVDKDGSFTIIYHFEDTLDLRPNRSSSNSDGVAYNIITSIIGGVYHDLLGATEMKVEAHWSSQFIK